MRALHEARDLLGVGSVVCGVTRDLLEIRQCAVALHASSGKPVLTIDNVSDITDAHRLEWLAASEMWLLDPYLRAVRESLEPAGEEVMLTDDFMRLARSVGYTGVSVHVVLLPILYSGGLLGTIRCGADAPYSAAILHDLRALATFASIRLAELGVTALADPLLARLTQRQVEIALLAARGLTNVDIADSLALSENTVKKHLKDVFAVLEITNRTELGALLARMAPHHGFASGVTHLDTVTITST